MTAQTDNVKAVPDEYHRYVWARVEVATGRPGESHPEILGAVQPEKAREALVALRGFCPGYGPAELFNDTNPMYIPRKTLEQVIRDKYQRDPAEIREAMLAPMYRRVEASTTDERAAEWASDHPKEHAEVVAKLGVPPGRAAYVALRRRRCEQTVDRLLRNKPLEASTGWLDVVAQLLDTTPEELALATHGDDDAPFFSEAYLYTLVGKDIARSVLSLLSRVEEALGVERYAQRPPALCPTCDRPSL